MLLAYHLRVSLFESAVKGVELEHIIENMLGNVVKERGLLVLLDLIVIEVV